MSEHRLEPDLTKVVAWDDYLESHSQESKEAADLYREAKDFLCFYSWCKDIKHGYVGILVPGVVGLFLFEIVPSKTDVDCWVWVVVGDIPPAYITCEDSPNPACALDAYIGAMSEWVTAASAGDSVENLIPVNAPATPEFASLLDKRLKFLDERVLNKLRPDLIRSQTG